MENKKKLLYIIVGVAVLAAVGFGLSMSGKLFRGYIGPVSGPGTGPSTGPATRPTTGTPYTGPVTYSDHSKKPKTPSCPVSKPISCPTTAPVSGPANGPAIGLPNKAMNKASFLRDVIQTILGVSNSELAKCTTAYFNDIKAGTPVNQFACYAYEKEIMKGSADGKFKPGDSLTRAEAAKILLSAIKVELGSPNGNIFKDVTAKDWYAPYVNYMKQKNFPNLAQDNQFYPNNELSISDENAWVAFIKTKILNK